MDLERDDWIDNQQGSNTMDLDGNQKTHSMGIQYIDAFTRLHTHKQILFIAFVSSVTEPEEEPGVCKKAVMCFCGLEQQKGIELTAEEQAELQKKLTDTTELPLWRNICNANAIILLCVAVFCHGFFA